jgi:hypothetical protein
VRQSAPVAAAQLLSMMVPAQSAVAKAVVQQRLAVLQLGVRV